MFKYSSIQLFEYQSEIHICTNFQMHLLIHAHSGNGISLTAAKPKCKQPLLPITHSSCYAILLFCLFFNILDWNLIDNTCLDDLAVKYSFGSYVENCWTILTNLYSFFSFLFSFDSVSKSFPKLLTVFWYGTRHKTTACNYAVLNTSHYNVIKIKPIYIPIMDLRSGESYRLVDGRIHTRSEKHCWKLKIDFQEFWWMNKFWMS